MPTKHFQQKFDTGSRIALFGLTGFVCIALTIWIQTSNSVTKRATAQEERHLNEIVSARAQEFLQNELDLERSVRFLAETPPIQGIIRAQENDGYDPVGGSNIEQWKSRLSKIFYAYLSVHKNVNQIRYIGVENNGLELVRTDSINGNPVNIPKNQLQEKGGRNYFREALTRKPGEIYSSSIDLNRERGKVVEPHVPTLRIAAPIYTAKSEIFGILIINVDLRNALSTFAEPTPDGVQPYLLNCEGDFLTHPDSTKAFGFDLGERYRWQDEFTPTEADSSMSINSRLQRFRSGDQVIYGLQKRLNLASSNNANCLYAAASISAESILGVVNEALQTIAAWLTAAFLIFTAFMVMLIFAIRNRDRAIATSAETAAIVDGSIDAIVGKDLNGVISSWNQAAEALFGYTGVEAIGHTVAELIIPTDRLPEEDRILASIARGDVVAPFETVRHRKDGSAVDVSVTVSPIRNRDGKVTGAAKIARDISQQKATQAQIEELNQTLEQQVVERTLELERSMALQRGVIDNAGYAVIATDANGVITLFNPAAEALLGYQADELIGKCSAADFHAPGELEARAAKLASELKQDIQPNFDALAVKARLKQGYETECSYVGNNGRPIPVMLKVSTLLNFDDEISGFLIIAIDLSRQKKQQNALIDAKAAAEAASKAKGDFVANMSHEIRSPMNAVLGMLQLLQRTPQSERQRDYTDKASAAARSLLDLINDILDFSKIEAGRVELDPQPFTIDDLLHDISVVIGANVGDKDVEVLFRTAANLPPRLFADAPRLKQVLLNLASNAVKFTEHGQVIIDIEQLNINGEQCELQFSVCDTGIGMSETQIARLFQAFTQAEAGTSRRFGGTGLGLVISRDLVKLMGGELHVQSQLGQGSRFSFSLTMDIAKADEIESRELTAKEQKSLQNLRVLIVDDHAAARQILSELCQGLGWRVAVAASGMEAEQIVQKDPDFDAIFVDYLMPGWDGWKTAERLRQRMANRTSPIMVMVTAHAREVLENRTQDDTSLVSRVLVKPVTASDIYDAVADAVLSSGQLITDQTENRKALNGLKILVVDDNATNRQIAMELLADEGAEVDLADGGQLAIDKALGDPSHFDLILMDMQMPGVDGLQATRKIRETIDADILPIVAMTANAMARDRKACLLAGMNEHVGKPFHIDDLVSTILSVLGKEPSTSAHRSTAESTLHDAHGFDFSMALQRLGNNRKLYAQECRKFVDNQSECLETVKNELNNDDRITAGRLLHTLRGVVGTLGALTLADTLADLESMLKNEDSKESIESKLLQAEQQLDTALKELNRLAGTLVPEDSPGDAREQADSSSPVDVHQAGNLIRELQSKLANSDLDAINLAADLAALANANGMSWPEALDAAINNLDFGAAQAELKQFKDKYFR